jgi:hypothetical protein
MVSLLTALYLEAGEGFSALFACFRLCRIEQPPISGVSKM